MLRIKCSFIFDADKTEIIQINEMDIIKAVITKILKLYKFINEEGIKKQIIKIRIKSLVT